MASIVAQPARARADGARLTRDAMTADRQGELLHMPPEYGAPYRTLRLGSVAP